MPEQAVKVTPFGTPVKEFVPSHSSKLYQKEIAQFDLEFDKETGDAHIVDKDPLDLDAQIQTYKDQCGIEFALLQMKRGLITQEQLAAAPGDYGDTSMLPDNINDAYQAAQAAEVAAGSVDLHQFKTDADIQAYVDKAVAAQLAAQEAAAKEAAAMASANPTEGDK